ncbi:MAG: glutamine synthetase beta-grasp domain-containing protein, partial [Gammaproteobacteria bacterium]
MSSKTLAMIKDNEAKWVDLRFTDPKGKEQHTTIPANRVDEESFQDGFMFDGSSIAGWKSINESDMILMPDDDTCVMDPFRDEKTLILRCDIIEPATMQPYDRDPRSIAKKAEAYLSASGIADTAYFGPENEFFVFDDVRWKVDMSGSSVAIAAAEAAWSSNSEFERGNMGHRPGVKGGYFPVPPVDSAADMRSAMCNALTSMGIAVEVHHHEVATAGQNEIG